MKISLHSNNSFLRSVSFNLEKIQLESTLSNLKNDEFEDANDDNFYFIYYRLQVRLVNP